MFALLSIICGIFALITLLAAESGSGGAFITFVILTALTIGFSAESAKTISVTNTLTPGTIVKTPNAVIAEIRVGDRIERATFTDIATHQRATSETRIIWRVTENSWGKSGVIVLDLP